VALVEQDFFAAVEVVAVRLVIPQVNQVAEMVALHQHLQVVLQELNALALVGQDF
jgi:hypothetical protein